MTTTSSAYIALSLTAIIAIALWTTLQRSGYFYRLNKIPVKKERAKSASLIAISALVFGFHSEILDIAGQGLFH
ncbi:hypothetical protein [Litorivivens sp.]|uniref:hypothetical protein n=1 Tax=Litorivivens sp. TaxID=2020868 RepID=UPI00356AB5C4